MKRVLKFIFISVLLFALDIVLNFDRVKLDGVFAEITSLFFFSDTQYSNKYTNEKFSQIKIGMTEREVIMILGEPISKFKPHKDSGDPKRINQIAFQYSYSPSKSHFRVRNIIFNCGKVIKKIYCFYTID